MSLKYESASVTTTHFCEVSTHSTNQPTDSMRQAYSEHAGQRLLLSCPLSCEQDEGGMKGGKPVKEMACACSVVTAIPGAMRNKDSR